jgi:hypothetical protein
LRIMPCVQPGAKLSIVVGLHATLPITADTSRFSIEGVVLRSDEKLGGACGVAVSFHRVRFL